MSSGQGPSRGRPPLSSGGTGRPPVRPAGGATAGGSLRRPPPGAGLASATGSTSSPGAPGRPPSVTQSLLPSRSMPTSRQGQARMVFRPKLPPRRSVDPQIKRDPDGPSPSGSPAPGSGRNSPASMSPAPLASARPMPNRAHMKRPAQQQTQMVASGPFGQGSGAISRRDHSRSAQVSGPSTMGTRAPTLAGLSMNHEEEQYNTARSSYREPDKALKKEREEYSDPEDDGIQIVDLEDVQQLDENAPRSLPRMKKESERKSLLRRSQTPKATESGSGEVSRATSESAADKESEARQADALDLSASEEEEVMDDLLEDFLGSDDGFGDGDDPENRLYLFQFPPLFPKFTRPPPQESPPTEDKAEDKPEDKTKAKVRRSVAFSDDTLGGGGEAGASPRASGSGSGSAAAAADVKSTKGDEDKTKPAVKQEVKVEDEQQTGGLEGQIGRLDVYRDGRVLLKLGKDLVMEVTGGSQATFLQQVMLLDSQRDLRATTLGEVHRKFVVAPEIASMLADSGDLLGDKGKGKTDDMEAIR